MAKKQRLSKINRERKDRENAYARRDDGDQDEGDVSGDEGTLVEIEYINSGVERDKSGDGESKEDEVNSVTHDSFDEEVEDGSGGEYTMGTPLEAAPMEHVHGTIVFMEAWFNKVDNMVREQSRLAESVDQLDKKVKKFTDVLNKSTSDASYDLNLLHGDMETMLICAQDLVEKTMQSRKIVVNFMERFDGLLGRYEEHLGQREMRKNWKRTWKFDHVDLDVDP
ncbi:hypothetical protein Scep_003928 [Stephania cephalantha]|uniref:Uncharacterized protein n=1 Tax=Stephania cephalantha TaxID=152367 RepID=A0AAP0KT13_9MAGN